MKFNPEENKMQTRIGVPYKDPKQTRTKNNPDWIVVEMGTSTIVHHRFGTLEAAEAFVASKKA